MSATRISIASALPSDARSTLLDDFYTGGDSAEASDMRLPEKVTTTILRGDARKLPFPANSVDVVVTSPPYWKKRDYGVNGQIGQEETPEAFVANILKVLAECGKALRPTGSVFLNIGDTYVKRSLAGIPFIIEVKAREAGWTLRNRIIWAKRGGMPEPAKDRLANRHEYILHFTKSDDHYYDLHGYAKRFGNGSNPGDVWTMGLERNMGEHLAPFPEELVERAIELACPTQVCSRCGEPRRRITHRTGQLDPSRPQAKRAMEIAKERGLTAEHIRAIQASGISDAGKARKIQTGTDKNADHIKKLAAEAKEALGGYFREFTFAKRETVGWTKCSCKAAFTPGVVLDPFVGTGTTLRVARRLARSSIGVDVAPPKLDELG